MTPTLTELLIVAATICMEAGGEPYAGKVMVGEVIANRARQAHQTPQKVCLAPNQFSCWYFRGTVRNKIRQARKSPAWNECLVIARGICQPDFKPTSPATHFFNPNYASPKWAEKMRLVAIVGNHRFYAEGK